MVCLQTIAEQITFSMIICSIWKCQAFQGFFIAHCSHSKRKCLMKKFLSMVSAVCFLAFFSANIVSAETIITAKNAKKIFEIAKGFGSASLDKDSDGDPRIRGRIDGIVYVVHFYGCEGSESKCQDIQFLAVWKNEENKITLEKVNLWNSGKRFSKAYLDRDGDLALSMVVNLDYGVTEENLQDTFNWWKNVLKNFTEEVVGDL
jgi:hypothetical protein